MSDRAAILRITPELLRDLLQLPEGAVIDHVQADLTGGYGVLSMRIRGAGWPVVEGHVIPQARPVVRRREARPEDGIAEIDWCFPAAPEGEPETAT